MASDEFDPLFERFKRMLAPYAARMHVSVDTATSYGLDMAPMKPSTSVRRKVTVPTGRSDRAPVAVEVTGM